MLTSFFSKSKPANFLVVLLLMAGFYLAVNLTSVFDNFNLLQLFEKIGVLGCFLLSVTILNFIAKKNDLTKRSAFKIIIFAVFAVSFWSILKSDSIIISNMCLLLSLRRVISLKSGKEVQMKVFDATFWVCIASLFYFWSILFLVVVYAGILLHVGSYFKNWLVPPIAALAVLLLVTAFHILVYGNFYSLAAWYQTSSFDFSIYSNPRILIPLSVILATSIWTIFNYLKLMQKANVRSRNTFILVFLTLVFTIASSILSPVKNGSELLFLFVPLSIIISNYFDHKKDKVFKQVLLFALILMPFLIPVFF